MVVKMKGKCLFASEPRSIVGAGGKAQIVKDFQFLCEHEKQVPEIIKVSSFNGFAPKIGEVLEFECRVSARVWKGNAQLNVVTLL